MPKDIQNFEADVIEASRERPILVDFWAEWCGPCRILGPILEKLAEENRDRWRLAKVDTERFPEEASRYGVRGIPNVKLFVDGVPVGEFVGALPEEEVRDWLSRTLPSDADRMVAQALEEAKGYQEQGRFVEAKAALERALDVSPGDPRLRLELARIVVFENPTRARELLDDLEHDARDQELVHAVRELARLFDADWKQEASQPIEGQRRYLEAVERLRSRDFVGALEALVEVLSTGSENPREEARKTCAALFHYLGSAHPVVKRFRGEVAGALYR